MLVQYLEQEICNQLLMNTQSKQQTEWGAAKKLKRTDGGSGIVLQSDKFHTKSMESNQ